MISKLKNFRINNKYTQQQMADLLNISLRAYRNYEYGNRQMPYKVLSKFLYIRNNKNDRELSEILNEYIKEGEYEIWKIK